MLSGLVTSIRLVNSFGADDYAQKEARAIAEIKTVNLTTEFQLVEGLVIATRKKSDQKLAK